MCSLCCVRISWSGRQQKHHSALLRYNSSRLDYQVLGKQFADAHKKRFPSYLSNKNILWQRASALLCLPTCHLANETLTADSLIRFRTERSGSVQGGKHLCATVCLSVVLLATPSTNSTDLWFKEIPFSRYLASVLARLFQPLKFAKCRTSRKACILEPGRAGLQRGAYCVYFRTVVTKVS